jgi:hypothetical protein
LILKLEARLDENRSGSFVWCVLTALRLGNLFLGQMQSNLRKLRR